MSKARVIVLSVVHQGLSKAEAARKFDVSWQWVHTLVTRYNTGGLDAVEPRSRRPASSSRRTPDTIRDRVLDLRQQLSGEGLDAGPVTIAWHLEQEGLTAPAASTIRRILVQASLITPEPKKRPKSSYIRFQADQPNETWQSDFTHCSLADDTDIEILNWLDDHSRLLLSCTAHHPVTGATVIATFTALINEYGAPASTLTDNGSVYTSKFTGGKNGFEYLLAAAGITQKNGHPSHPQTQGKIERSAATATGRTHPPHNPGRFKPGLHAGSHGRSRLRWGRSSTRCPGCRVLLGGVVFSRREFHCIRPLKERVLNLLSLVESAKNKAESGR